MRNPKPKSTRYGNGQYSPAGNGRGFDCRITVRGVRHRSRLPNEAAARAWIDAADADTPLSCPLTRAQMLDAQEAFYKLPESITISKLVENYLVRESAAPVTTSEAIARFLTNRENRVKSITLSGYRTILRQFSSACPEMLSDITQRQIDDFLSRFGKVRRNTILAHIKAFLAYVTEEEMLTINPATRIKKIKTPEPPKSVFSIEETERLLHSSEQHNPRLVPYIALGLFAGIRPGELSRLNSDAIRGEYIALTGKDTKTADARTIRIRPNLAKWLKAYPFTGNVSYLPHRSQLKAVSEVRESAGIASWPKDVMRHSFATYAYEMEKDAAHIASEMGHHGTDVFFRHYRALALPGDGKKFFSIVPKMSTNCQRQ